MNIIFNNRVKQICRSKGMQLKDLAAKMGVAPESLSRTLNGNPQLSSIESIAEALGVSISDLFMEKEQRPNIVICSSNPAPDKLFRAVVYYNGNTYISDDFASFMVNNKHIADNIREDEMDWEEVR